MVVTRDITPAEGISEGINKEGNNAGSHTIMAAMGTTAELLR